MGHEGIGENQMRKPKNRRKNPAYDIDPLKVLEMLLGSGMRDNPFNAHFVRHEPETQVVELGTMWRKIMMLCHPDKHGNSELSQEVTRWLIENRPN